MKVNDTMNPNIFKNSEVSKNQPNAGLGDFFRISTPIDSLTSWVTNDTKAVNNTPKWDLSKVPLKYYIKKNVNDEKFIPRFIDAVQSSFLPWSRGSYGLIRFSETFHREDADITVNWSDRVVFGRDFEVGHTDLKIVNNKIEKAEVTLVIYPIIDRMALIPARAERIRRTSLHELGHALGLNHSNSSKDVMYHRGTKNKMLSTNDIRRLNELYNNKDQRIIG